MTVVSGSGDAGHVLKTPIWILVVRGFQFLFSLIIVGLVGTLIHDAYLDEEGLALAMVCSQRPAPRSSLLLTKI